MNQHDPIELNTNQGGDRIHELDLPKVILDAYLASNIAQDPNNPTPWEFDPATLDITDWPYTLKLELMYQAQTGWHPADGISDSYWNPNRADQARTMFQDHPQLLQLFANE